MERNRRRTLSGVVVSDKMEKTRVVEVQSFKKHPLYGKRMKWNKRYKMHDEKNESSIGDVVKMVETKKISKDKYFRLLTIKEKSKIKYVAPVETKKPEPITKKAVKKAVKPVKKAAAKPPVKKAVAKPTTKPVVKKTPTTKPAAKKAPAKVAAKPKPTTKKPATKKPVAKK